MSGSKMADRVSRRESAFHGSLRGLSRKTFSFVQKICAKNTLVAARRYMSEETWKKLDRSKPVGEKQLDEIKIAINRVLRETIPDYPFYLVTIKWKTYPILGYKNKRIFEQPNFVLTMFESVSTEFGTGYYITKEDTLSYDGLSAPIAFSRHAIERLMERCPKLNLYSYGDVALPAKFLMEVTSSGKLIEEAGLMLSAYPCGFFPVKFSNGFWICTSFLTPEMEGTPSDKSVIEKLRGFAENKTPSNPVREKGSFAA